MSDTKIENAKNDFGYKLGDKVRVLIEKTIRLSPFTKSVITIPSNTEGEIFELRSTLIYKGIERGHRVKVDFQGKKYIVEVHPQYLRRENR